MNPADRSDTLEFPDPPKVPETCAPIAPGEILDTRAPEDEAEHEQQVDAGGVLRSTQRTAAGHGAVPINLVPGYEILGELGRGGMGIVYRARQTHLKRVVALKMIRTERASREELTRFVAEARVVARLQHPNIVQIYEVGEYGGTPFFSLEYVAGGSLDRTIGGKPQPPRDSAALIRRVALAMQAAHDEGIIHRDLKPANILLGRKSESPNPKSETRTGGSGSGFGFGISDLEPKVSDFGLAKQLDDVMGQTASGVPMGTPAYMPPEQAEGRLKDVGPRADVYSLGATLYELLTGRSPFTGTSVRDLLEQVCTRDPVPPSRLTPSLPRDLETICLKCLHKDLGRRYASARDLADDLERYLDRKPIAARPVSTWERGLKWARRRPAQAALVAALLLAVLAGTSGALFYGLYKDEQATALRHREERSRQVVDLWGRGQAAEANRDYSTAQQYYDQALATLKTDTDADGAELRRLEDSRARVRTRLAETDARVQLAAARGDFQKNASAEVFGAHRDQALFHAVSFHDRDAVGAAELAVIRREAPRALARVGLSADRPQDFGTQRQRWERLIEKPERDRLAAECYGVLLAWAKVEATAVPEESRRLLAAAAALAAAFNLDAARLRSTIHLFQDALESYRKGQVEQAALSCEKVLGTDPNHFWAQYLKALCNLRAKRWGEAKVGLTACLGRRRDHASLLLLLGTAHAGLKEFAAAEAAFAKAWDGDPRPAFRAAVLTTRGFARIGAGRWDDARADLLQAIALQPKAYQGYVNLARAYNDRGDRGAAIAALDKAIQLRQDPALYYRRAKLNADCDEWAQARLDLEEGIRREPSGAKSRRLAAARVTLAQFKNRDGEYVAALADCKGALDAVPGYPPAYGQRAATLHAMGKDDEAAEALDRYLAGGTRAPAFYRLRGLIHARRADTLRVKGKDGEAGKELARAIEAYGRCIEQGPDAQALTLRGWAYLMLGSPLLALPDFDAAVRLGPTNADALCGRGLARVQLIRTNGMPPEAVARDVRAATVDAEEALRLPQTASRDAAEVRRRLLLNCARVHARAVGVLALAGERPADGRMASRCLNRALHLLDDTLARVAPAKQRDFWRGEVRADPAFQPIRTSGGMGRRDQLYGR